MRVDRADLTRQQAPHAQASEQPTGPTTRMQQVLEIFVCQTVAYSRRCIAGLARLGDARIGMMPPAHPPTTPAPRDL